LGDRMQPVFLNDAHILKISESTQSFSQDQKNKWKISMYIIGR
jgi:hypothetical protein